MSLRQWCLYQPIPLMSFQLVVWWQWKHCRTWAVPNLFVVDGSFMPTSGGAAPTLTILANSFRVAHHILERARQGMFEAP